MNDFWRIGLVVLWLAFAAYFAPYMELAPFYHNPVSLLVLCMGVLVVVVNS